MNADLIRRRADLTRDLRGFFDAHGYVEVETPLLSREVCVDAHIDPIVTADGKFLQPSPELAMKRLLANEDFAIECPAIWQLTKAFRHGERGHRHSPEFTMCEWYRVGDTHREQMAFTEELCDAMHRTRHAIPQPPPRPYPRVAYWDAVEETTGEDFSQADGAAIGDWLRRSQSVASWSETTDRDGWLNALLALVVEPWLARHPACFLVDYPASQAALATVRRDGRIEVAERFELYMTDGDGGVIELANGYNELTDAAESRRRFERANGERADALPLPDRFLNATDRLPKCSGVALGWDRLLMHLLRVDTIAEIAVLD